WQPRFWFRRKETVVPWRSRGERLPRYYYLFSRGELVRRVTEAGFRVLPPLLQSSSRSKRGLFSRNVCLLVTKD
ncbi:MAG: class I SAM-dependent methyltransferase, partial [Dehalococcoidales bacterium]